MNSNNIVSMKPGDIFSNIDSGELFTVEKHLGTGGFGSAYLVTQTKTSQKSVAKIPLQTGDKTDDYIVKKLNHEARILKLLQQERVPNIVQIKSLFQTEINRVNIPSLLLELAPGKTCEDLLCAQKSQCLDEDTVKRILEAIGKALVGVHKHGIIHRDIKPENVFVDDITGNLKVTLIDFGIAAFFDNSSTMGNATNLGTDFYAPPEQMKQGIVSPSSDVFSLAATGFYLTTGIRVGWLGKYDPSKFAKTGYPISKEFSNAMVKASWPEMSERYATIDDFLLALQGRPPIHLVQRIVVDGVSYAIDKEQITIGRADTGVPLDIEVSERTVSGKNYISRNHCHIKQCDDGYYRLYDGSPDGNPSTNKTVWMDRNKMWRAVGHNGIILGAMPLVIGLGFQEGKSNERDLLGNPILPGAYRVIEYRPPD